MKSINESRNIVFLMLLTAFLICGVQDVSYSGDVFWEVGEALGAGFGAVGEGLGAAGEGVGAGLGGVWEAFDTIGEAVGIHPVELIATGGLSAIIRLIPLPEANAAGHVRGASSIFVMPDGRHIGIVASGSVYFWDPHMEQFTAPLIHGAPIFRFVVSPSGGMLATTSEGGNVQLWTRDTANADSSWVPTGQQLDMSIVGYTTWAQLKLEPKIHILSTAFSPDSEILAGGSARGTVRLWNATTGGLRTTLRGHSDTVTSVTFSPDGRRLATASVDGTVRLWNPATGAPEATLSGHRSSVVSVAFNPMNDQLASANVNGSVRLWDPDTRTVHALLGNGSPVTTVAFGADKHTIIAGSRDGQIRQWEVWDSADSAPDILTASTASPLTEPTIHENTVTLTLSRLAFAPSVFDIRDAVTVSGIPGVTIPWHQPDRKSDTEITVELEFNGNIDKDAILTFNVGANAVPGYFGPALTAQIPVVAFTESVTASTASPLTEASLDGSVVTLTLDGGAYARSRIDIGEALKVSGVAGVTVEWSDVDRLSDTEVTVELGFSGDIDSDATLTFSIGASAIAGYGGSDLTAQLPVTASMESVAASTTSPLTEHTLDGTIVTLTLNGRDYAESIFDIRDAVKVSGVDGVTMPWHQPDRKSDTVITMTLEFNGDLDEDAALTFTVGADAIANYNGPALTVRLPVTASTESVAVSTLTPLTERTLNGSVVTLTLSGCTYEQSIRDVVKVSGVAGVEIPWRGLERKSDTELEVTLEFDGNMTADATLVFSLDAGAIAGYGGPDLTAQLPVTATTESVAASTLAPLTEGTLNGSAITLTLSGRTYEQSIWDVQRAVKVSGVSGATVDKFSRVSDTEVTAKLEFEGNIDTDATLTFSVGAGAVEGYGGLALTAQLPVTASTESVAASTSAPLTEQTLSGSVVTLTLNGRDFAPVWDIRDVVEVSGVRGVTVEEYNIDRVSDTEATVKLEFNGNIDANATLTFSVGAGAIEGYNGLALAAQLPVTASTESVVASTESPLTEVVLDESVVTLTLSGCTFERSIFDIRDAVTVAGIDGVTIPWHQPDRQSDTRITIELEFDGDMDAAGTLTFTVGAGAIANYTGPVLTAQLPVTASKEFALAPNFPNPFNPETWIPYQLATDAEVTLTIHSQNGQPVRRMTLGRQVAGTYYSRSRAAYWDGKNDFGESVASGVYFYTLTAGDFSATRKMLIQK